MSAIRELCDRQGVTIVLITHYMEEAAMADRVVVMHRGKILIQGAPAEVFSQIDLLRSNGLDVPQPVELAELLRAKGFDIPAGILTPEQCAAAIAKLAEKKPERNCGAESPISSGTDRDGRKNPFPERKNCAE